MRILVVDDEAKWRRLVADTLADAGHEIDAAAGGAEALSLLEAARYDLILTDLKMPPPDGLELLRTARKKWPETAVILMTAFATARTASEALAEHGAYHYHIKPVELAEVRRVVARLAEERRTVEERDRLREENASLRATLDGRNRLADVIGTSRAMQEVFALAAKVAETDATVLLRGESGTGKDRIARAIHSESARSKAAFIKVNCGALPETLLESELFGHEK